MPQAPLKDHFGRIHDYLRISLTDKCNLRCFYCMPAEGINYTPHHKLMQPDEIHAIASGFVKAGVNKIRLTGGEPLVRKDAGDILHRLAELPVELAITTNGILIDKYLDIFRQTGLKSINISLDSLDKDKFAFMTRRNYFDKVWDNIHLFLQHGYHIKLNVVVNRYNQHEIPDFIALTRYHNLHVRFIEFMPFQGNQWEREHVVPYEVMLDTVKACFPVTKIEDKPHDTAKNYYVEGYRGTFAFITSVTAPFCSSCNRLRLTADGKMRNCLFSDNEADILGALRAQKDFMPLIEQNVKQKMAQTGGKAIQEGTESRSMIAIGG